MAGKIRLFEKTDAGLLIEVDPADADRLRTVRRVSRCDLPVEILWTAAEETERDAEEAAAVAEIESSRAADQEKAAARAIAIEKIGKLGISVDDLKALLG